MTLAQFNDGIQTISQVRLSSVGNRTQKFDGDKSAKVIEDLDIWDLPGTVVDNSRRRCRAGRARANVGQHSQNSA